MAEADGAGWRVALHVPVNGLDRMGHQVRKIAAAKIPELPPCPEFHRIERLVGRRSQPGLPVEIGRRRLTSGKLIDSSHAVIHEPEGFHKPHDAQGARGDDFFALDVVRPTALLGTGLHDPAALLDGLDLLGTFFEGVRHRFLEIDVLSRRERIDEHLFVPVVGGRDDHGLNIFLIQELAVVVELGRVRTGPGGGLVAMGLVDVGHGHQVRAVHGLRLPLRNPALNRVPSAWGSGDPSTARPGRLSRSRRSAPDHWLPRTAAKELALKGTQRHAPLRRRRNPRESGVEWFRRSLSRCSSLDQGPRISNGKCPDQSPSSNGGPSSSFHCFFWASVRTASSFLAWSLRSCSIFGRISSGLPPDCTCLTSGSTSCAAPA